MPLPLLTALTCGPASTAAPPPFALPPAVTGRVAFYAALYPKDRSAPTRAFALGETNAVMPLASAYKTLVVWAALRDVDAGRLTLRTPLATTAANRSIEFFSPGTNPLRFLARQAVRRSENTASDVLHRAVGEGRVSDLVAAASPCTKVDLTTKAWWAAQAGLLPNVWPTGDARPLAARTPTERRDVAARLNAASLAVDAGTLEKRLDDHFRGPASDPALDTALQNTSTARAFAELQLAVYRDPALSEASRRLLRGLLAEGCCRPAAPGFGHVYWGAKAGSGWRLLTLSGFVELPDGRALAYTYLNHESDTREAEDLERQIPAVAAWIARALRLLVPAR